MNIIDNDLLSVQEARIILETCVSAREELKVFSKESKENLIKDILGYFKANLKRLVDEAFQETDFGKPEDEVALGKYFIDNFEEELKKYSCIGEVVDNKSYDGKMVGLPKGICVNKLGLYLPIVTYLNNLILAIHTQNPIIFIPNQRCLCVIVNLTRDINEIAKDYHYPQEAIATLSHVSDKCEVELFSNNEVAFVVENLLCEKSSKRSNYQADWFTSTMGNNVVFVEKTADLSKAAKDIVNSKSFNNGLLPGVEQSIIVETDIYENMKLELEKNGAYFLSDTEREKIGNILYDANSNPRLGLIGKSALEICRIGGIEAPSDVKVLVVTRPYVSSNSPYSKEKFAPILSLYIEDDWRFACEKCIELILNDNDGQSLTIYTTDAYVIEQFIEKKPVARVLVNQSTGFGSVGLTSTFPLSLSLSTKEVAGISCKSLNPNHFMYFREIGLDNGNDNSLLDRYRDEDKFIKSDYFIK